MNNSMQILDQMCRACMCKNQRFHSIYDKAQDNSLRIYEIFATTIPQVPINTNDGLPKKICVACLNILRIIHNFQQMCIASDSYMHSLLASNKLTSIDNIRKQQVEICPMVMTQQQTVKVDSPLVMQNLIKDACAIKVEMNDDKAVDEPTEEEYRDNNAMDSEYSDDDDCPHIKFEADDEEVQECDLKISLTTKRQKTNAMLLEYRSGHNNNSGDSTGPNYNSEDNTSTTIELSAADETPNTQFLHNQKLTTLSQENKQQKQRNECYLCKVALNMDSQLEDNTNVNIGLKPFLCDNCNKDTKFMFIESPWATPCLVLNNYLYNCQIRQNNREYWRCHNYSKKQQADRCRSRCVLENGKLKKFTGGSHNHLPHTEKIEKMITRNRTVTRIPCSSSGLSRLKLSRQTIPLGIQQQEHQKPHKQQPQEIEQRVHSPIIVLDD